MILRTNATNSQPAAQSGTNAVPIWNAIQARQIEKPGWCVTQVDHARLSGQIAQHIDPEIVPALETTVVQSISLHDEGWAELDSKSPVRSFLEVQPKEFLPAWRASIQAAGKVSELGAAMVGGHFSRLAKARLELAPNTAAEVELVTEFLNEQEQAQRKRSLTLSDTQVEEFVDLLQFCDVFSLYLCCGAQERVQLPQKLGGTIFQLYRQGEWCVSSPPLFANSIQLQLPAWEVTAKGEKGKAAPLTFQLR
jgi:Protein of unknown function (DUF3891)